MKITPFVFLFGLFLILFSCKKEEAELDMALQDHEKEYIHYFSLVAPTRTTTVESSGIIYKWIQDPKIFITGEYGPIIKSELNLIIAEINELVGRQIRLSIVDDSTKANVMIYIEDPISFGNRKPAYREALADNWGYTNFELNDNNGIIGGWMFLDNERGELNHQTYIFRRLICYLLGMTGRTTLFESIFYNEWHIQQDFQEVDEVMFRMMYHPLITPGMGYYEAKRSAKKVVKLI